MIDLYSPALPKAPDGGGLVLHHCGMEQCAPGHRYGPAVRDHYLLHCVLSGQGCFTAAGRSWRLRAGDAFLIRPDEVTVYEADSADPWQYGWVGLQGAGAAPLLRQLGDWPILRFRDPATAADCLRRILRQFHPEGNWFLLQSELYRLFSLFSRPQAPKASAAQAAAAYIRQNYSYPLTIEQLAAFAGVHRSHLFRLFRQEYGVSPQQYLAEQRLQQAARLLRLGFSVTEAAYSCGYGDLPHFSRRFRARFGLAPSAYAATPHNKEDLAK